MIIFIEALIILFVFRFVYLSITGEKNPLNISKPFGLAILLVAFLVLPPVIKVMMIIMVIVYLFFKSTKKTKSPLIQTFLKE